MSKKIILSANKSRARVKINMPVSWRILSLLSMFPLGMLIFYVIFSKSGGKFPLAAGDSTDPFFFGFVFSVLLPAIVYIFIIDKILKGIVTKRSGKDIAKDVAVDVAKTAAAMAAGIVVDAALGGSSAGSRSSSSSSGSTKGGDGDFGGGGASGGY